ncbi:hypothetical protein DIPPA_13952 [Diplonema papillatum]|nr:hypothetical protein DIPPA_13952 [Diplonema papillatum]|eukprot:gene6953-10697_t
MHRYYNDVPESHMWPDPQSGGHKSISLEKELRDRGLHASADRVANGLALDDTQETNVVRADVELQGSPHRFGTHAFNAHVDSELCQPPEWRSPRRALAGPVDGLYTSPYAPNYRTPYNAFGSY